MPSSRKLSALSQRKPKVLNDQLYAPGRGHRAGGAMLMHNYQEKLTRALEAAYGAGMLPGGAYVVVIRHDDWCPLLRETAGQCNCDPDLEVQSLEDYQKVKAQ